MDKRVYLWLMQCKKKLKNRQNQYKNNWLWCSIWGKKYEKFLLRYSPISERSKYEERRHHWCIKPSKEQGFGGLIIKMIISRKSGSKEINKPGKIWGEVNQCTKLSCGAWTCLHFTIKGYWLHTTFMGEYIVETENFIRTMISEIWWFRPRYSNILPPILTTNKER